MTRHRRWMLGLLATAALAAASCDLGKPPFGDLLGDAYVVLDSGREARLRSHPIHLLPDTAGLDTLLSHLCIERNRSVAPLQRQADSILTAHFRDQATAELGPQVDSTLARLRDAQRAISEQAWRRRVDILRSMVTRSVRTDANGSFMLDSLPPGEYRLWTDAEIGGNRWTWLHRVEVERGDTVRADLHNTNVDENPLRCPTEFGIGPSRSLTPGTALAVSSGPLRRMAAPAVGHPRREEDPLPGG